MINIKEKISTNRSLNHIIFNDIDVNPKSYSSYVLLVNYYKERDITFQEDNDWRYYFIIRRHFLRKVKKKDKYGNYWTCHYCGKRLNKIQKRNKKGIQKGCVTVDHIIPVSDEKCNKLDTSNMVESCYRCNSDKGTMDYQLFINKKDGILR